MSDLPAPTVGPNLYLVISERLIHYPYARLEPPEEYRICELVVARNYSQARYLAWKSDRYSHYADDLREMPKMAVRLKVRDFPGSPHVLDHAEGKAALLNYPGADWIIGNAPHIGIVDLDAWISNTEEAIAREEA